MSNNSPQNVDKSQEQGMETNKRRLLLKAGVPAILTITSSPVFATSKICNISGFQSAHPSGVARHETSGCGGYSPGAWKNPYSGRGDGSLADWIVAGQNLTTFYGIPGYSAGFFPNPDGTNSSTAATTFDEIFGGGGTHTLHDKTLGAGTRLQKFAVTAFLNGCFFQWGIGANDSIIHPLDVVGLYNATPGSVYLTMGGNEVTRPGNSALADFFQQTQH